MSNYVVSLSLNIKKNDEISLDRIEILVYSLECNMSHSRREKHPASPDVLMVARIQSPTVEWFTSCFEGENADEWHDDGRRIQRTQ